MHHRRLKQCATDLGFPAALIDTALSTHRVARILTYDGQAAPELFPSNGIVAGGSLSDVLIKLYYVQDFDRFVKRHPQAELDVYFDDI